MKLQRVSGILLHPTSLPGTAGIGELGKEAREFVLMLERAGQSLWQVLPLGPTGYGDSPYQSTSTFAGNELLISFEPLIAEGLISEDEARSFPYFDPISIDYEAVAAWKTPLLEKVAVRFFERSSKERMDQLKKFCAEQAFWLEDYALFSAIKKDYDAQGIKEGVASSTWSVYWPKKIAMRDPATIEEQKKKYLIQINIRSVLQFIFFEQWHALKKFANEHGIKIIGDIPIFVSADSADMWVNPKLFLTDKNVQSTFVAGVPPDYFSADGQLWGNPLYNWPAHEKEKYAWWITRMRAAFALYDFVRIDHFRAFDSYWAIPAGAKTAREGEWRAGPGIKFFRALEAALGELPVIAEDLGGLTAGVHKLRDDLGAPGMAIMEFAFDLGDNDAPFDSSNPYLPHNIVKNCVMYTGTHDNDTLCNWQKGIGSKAWQKVRNYLGYDADQNSPWPLLQETWKTVAIWAIAPLQDILGLDGSARMNIPSTLGGINWKWRMHQGSFTHDLQERIKWLTEITGRSRK